MSQRHSHVYTLRQFNMLHYSAKNKVLSRDEFSYYPKRRYKVRRFLKKNGAFVIAVIAAFLLSVLITRFT